MHAEELLKQGDLSGALAALQDAVRKAPSDAKLRIFLFQLLTVTGDWKRAVTQLKLCAELDKSALAMAQTYREAIICEVYREKVFSGEKSPLVFGEPPEWLALQMEALKVLAAGRPAEAADLRARAFDVAPAIPGTINGTPFEWIADADMRLGPVLEIIVNGRYFWAPFGAIHKLEIDPPTDLRDRVWTPAHVVWSNGGDAVALIPTRYPGTTATTDDALRLARMTTWEDAGAETYVGLGGRLLATDAGDTALMDLRELVIGDAPESAATDAAGEGADG
ncbi:tetratricopeptide repeat protein [Limibaculum sp. FT325]|uniref:type VI secretion system accessory protein TagJ n=1 Tax=Thermohalobaculum sediminis TaxID=2939436 RepID=UPI0020BDCEDF|nr:type VI secretion system accessory protein TagJ [Limibaculum sediminis]MCL5777300.1 tetratricopeptide repeat protein [Limibaculum sediminis]